jgi:uncharacterized tellurite resistance protein B-like protein
MEGFEYVSTLSIDEKVLFLRLIIKVISEDGKIDSYERQFIRNLAKQYQIPAEYADKINAPSDFDELMKQAQNLLDRPKALYLIKELLAVANTDNDFSEDEVDFVVKVSEKLGIESEKVVELNQLVLDRLNWLKRYRQALEIDQ